MTTTRTLTQQASDRVFAAQRAQHRAWLPIDAHRRGMELLATDPEQGAARATEVIAKCWRDLQGLAEPQEVAA